MTTDNIITEKRKFKRLQPKYIALLIIAAVSLSFHIITRYSTSISDFFNFSISNFIRGLLAAITSVVPFSLGETVVIILPVLMLVLVVTVIIKPLSDKAFSKVIYRLSVLVVGLYSLFVISLAPAYGSSTADVLFDITDAPLSKEELKTAAFILSEKTNSLADEINYSYGSFSKMDTDLDGLTDKLLDAYDSLEDKYEFIGNFKSRLKPIALSEPMTYTHISGVYTYYTGESNLNTNFPDYTIPFTAAHEMAHQRGFAREMRRTRLPKPTPRSGAVCCGSGRDRQGNRCSWRRQVHHDCSHSHGRVQVDERSNHGCDRREAGYGSCSRCSSYSAA